MGIPYTAPAVVPNGTPAPQQQGGAQRQAFAGTNPATGKPWTVDELQARMQSAPAPTDTEEPADAGAGAFGNMAGQLAKGGAAQPNSMANAPVSKTNTANPGNPNATPRATTTTNPDVAAAYNASLKAGKPASITKTSTAPKTMGMRRTNVKRPATTATLPAGGGTGVKAAVPAPDSLSGWKANATGGAGVKAAADSEKRLSSDEFIKLINPPFTPESRVFNALKKPVAEMLQMVETKQDVQRIKQFVDDTFVKYGAVTESAFVVRNRLIEHVTQVGAQRRREYARQS
jgi:hypothetical protein